MPDNTSDYYRSTFSSADGKRVLAHLLADMGFWDDNITAPDEVAVRNYALKILKRLGCIDPKNLDYFAEAFVNAPRIGEQENE